VAPRSEPPSSGRLWPRQRCVAATAVRAPCRVVSGGERQSRSAAACTSTASALRPTRSNCRRTSLRPDASSSWKRLPDGAASGTASVDPRPSGGNLTGLLRDRGKKQPTAQRVVLAGSACAQGTNRLTPASRAKTSIAKPPMPPPRGELEPRGDVLEPERGELPPRAPLIRRRSGRPCCWWKPTLIVRRSGFPA
jgi:hypothetical protein